MSDTKPTRPRGISEDRLLPPVPELKRLLGRYFEGPITDEIAEKLHHAMVELLADGPRRSAEVSAYFGNRARCEGKAWYEDFSSADRVVNHTDLALFHAATTRGWPKAKPYCPEYFVGTWTQLEEDGRELTWTFGANGEVETEQRGFARFREWHVKRHPRPEGRFPHALLCFREGEYFSWRDHTIKDASDDAFVVRELLHRGAVDHRLVRATPRQEGHPG